MGVAKVAAVCLSLPFPTPPPDPTACQRSSNSVDACNGDAKVGLLQAATQHWMVDNEFITQRLNQPIEFVESAPLV